jgi:26S proteasome regulatory subunit N12
MAHTLQTTKRALDKLKKEAKKGQFDACRDTLVEIKLHLTHFTSLPPRFEKTASAKDELLLGRECLEQGVLISVQMQDENAFERNFLQLNTYYTDTKDLIPPSEQELLIRGLNLLRLLVQNRIAEFHTELETLAPHIQNNSPFIKYVIQLEQSHMEGAYNKILNASKECPSEFYVPFAEKLIKTVRDEIGACSEEAYESLTIEEAQKLMRFSTKKEVLQYAQENEWVVEGNRIVFKRDATTDNVELNSMELIKNTLHYAKEIERIV